MAGVSAEGKRQGRVSSEKAKHQNPGSPPHGQTAQTLSHGHTLKGKGRVVRGSTGTVHRTAGAQGNGAGEDAHGTLGSPQRCQGGS